MTKPASRARAHTLSIDANQAEILADALQMHRDYLSTALRELERDKAADETRRDLAATDALLRRLRRRWPRL